MVEGLAIRKMRPPVKRLMVLCCLAEISLSVCCRVRPIGPPDKQTLGNASELRTLRKSRWNPI